MNCLQSTIEKIENISSIAELNKIEFVVNYPAIGWSENDKSILNYHINNAKNFIQLQSEKIN